MDFNDKANFAEALNRTAISLNRKITTEETDVYFKELMEYPFDLVKRGIKVAIISRDPDDIYLKRAMLTVPEIRIAIEGIQDEEKAMRREAGGSVRNCEKCDGMGWQYAGGAGGTLVAWPCECLYQAAEQALRENKRMDPESKRQCKSVIAAYHYHAKNWGGI